MTAPPAAEIIAGLPAPLADGSDPAAGHLALLGGLEPAQQAQTLLGAVTGDPGIAPDVAGSAETRLALARALIAAGDLDTARRYLAELAAGDMADWRVAWYDGLCELVAGRPGQARSAFSAVYDELPGELAPKLALAFAAEAAGDLAAGDRLAAIAAVAAVPETSSHHTAAQIAAVRLLVSGGARLSAADLHQADVLLGRLPLEDNDPRRHQLAVDVLRSALDWVAAAPPASRQGAAPSPAARILGCEPNERSLRFGLERGYRTLATLLPGRRVELVDQANSVRPRTWI